MKNLLLTASALLVFAGSSMSAATLHQTQIAGKDKPKTTAPDSSTNSIPPPTCPPGDPNGCGIFDGL